MKRSAHWMLIEDSRETLLRLGTELKSFRQTLHKYRHNKEIVRNTKQIIDKILIEMNGHKDWIRIWTPKAKEHDRQLNLS